MPEQRRPDHVHIAVIGAGFGGIGLAVKLREAGFDDIAILERADDLGGTWRDNTYPGCACDVASHLYSYSFAPNPDWSRAYSKQPEILDYLRRVATEHAVLPHIRFNTELLSATWNADHNLWQLSTNTGPMTCNILLSATGVYGDAQLPDIPGRGTFAGTAFHTLHWNHDHDLSGERVAIIGTGATAVQVVPEIQPSVQQLLVFQRSAPWIIPRLDRITTKTERRLLRRLPALGKAMRASVYAAIEGFGLVGFVDTRFRYPYEMLGRLQLRRQVRDPELRRRLTPDDMIGCKRAIFSDTYLPALTRDNVAVITTRIAEIRPHAIVTVDGTVHPVDTIIYSTGFSVPPAIAERIHGRDGTVADLYRQAPRSYLGTSMVGFPNFFTTLGVFGAVGNQSAIYMIECQIRYIIDALTTMRDQHITSVEVHQQAQDAFVREVNDRSSQTVWLTGGCATTYYRTADGHNAGLYPNWSFEYRRRTSKFDPTHYTLHHADKPQNDTQRPTEPAIVSLSR
ncbi:NAD(P)/FAD-dependent oxidoreductase [Nocardia sp. NPDC046473]|uniref:flavin-containing monooxygenase n=1 Tax=Nocardia sp. NPDC046473 TaxID=3155733 RepID=UPI0033C60A75